MIKDFKQTKFYICRGLAIKAENSFVGVNYALKKVKLGETIYDVKDDIYHINNFLNSIENFSDKTNFLEQNLFLEIDEIYAETEKHNSHYYKFQRHFKYAMIIFPDFMKDKRKLENYDLIDYSKNIDVSKIEKEYNYNYIL